MFFKIKNKLRYGIKQKKREKKPSMDNSPVYLKEKKEEKRRQEQNENLEPYVNYKCFKKTEKKLL
jgi:hypothetical protein